MRKQLAVWIIFLSLFAAAAFGYEITERYRLGAIVESITYISDGPLAGKVAFIDGWCVYLHDPMLGNYQKTFSVAGTGFVAVPRGIAYLSQGEFAGNFIMTDTADPDTLYIFTATGALVGTVQAQGFQWISTEGMAEVTSGPNQGQVAMISVSSDGIGHIYIYRLERSGNDIIACLERDIPNIASSSLRALGLAFLPANFPDPAYANMFVVSYDTNPILAVFDSLGNRVVELPGLEKSEGLTYISTGTFAGKLLITDWQLFHTTLRSLDGTYFVPDSIPLVGLGLSQTQRFSWLKERQQVGMIGWDGRDFDIPIHLISRQAEGLWHIDSQFRYTRFRNIRNMTDRANDGTYKLFGIITPRNVNPSRLEVDRLDAGLNRIDTLAIPTQYAGQAFGVMAYVPGETAANDRYVTPARKRIFSFDALLSYPAQITDISAFVTNNIVNIDYDPANQRYYLLDGLLMRIFSAAWEPLGAYDLSPVSPAPFVSISKITSGDLRGNICFLSSDDNELFFLNFEYQVAATLLDRQVAEIRAAGLSNGRTNSLTQKLANAAASVEKKNVAAAINKIEAFQNEVRAQRGKDIPGATADLWLTQSADIIRGLQALL